MCAPQQQQQAQQQAPLTVAGSPAKKRKVKVNHACVYCRRSHMTCDNERPCARCLKRNIGHLCHDEPRDDIKKPRHWSSSSQATSSPGVSSLEQHTVNSAGGSFITIAPNTVQNDQAISSIPPPAPQQPPQYERNVRAPDFSPEPGNPTSVQPFTSTPAGAQLPSMSTASSPTGISSNGIPGVYQLDMQNQMHDAHFLQSLQSSYMSFNAPEALDEYNVLSNFLNSSMQDETAVYNAPGMSEQVWDPVMNPGKRNAFDDNGIGQQNTTYSQQQQGQPPPAISQLKQPMRPYLPSVSQSEWQSPQQAVGSDSNAQVHTNNLPELVNASRRSSLRGSFSTGSDEAKATYYHVAADPSGTESAERRMNKLLKAKYDAGLLKPFNYVSGYARMNHYMEQHLQTSSRNKILRQLEKFRPLFRERMRSLTDLELVLVEMWFDRTLMEYDRVFASMAIPACCWRRTGEIFRGNKEMAQLIGVPIEQLRDGKLAIHEIIVEDHLVQYWEQFGAIAFNSSKKAMLTSCVLKNPQSAESDPGIECCSSFTIRRDSCDIPSIIVGNFLPKTSASR